MDLILTLIRGAIIQFSPFKIINYNVECPCLNSRVASNSEFCDATVNNIDTTQNIFLLRLFIDDATFALSYRSIINADVSTLTCSMIYIKEFLYIHIVTEKKQKSEYIYSAF